MIVVALERLNHCHAISVTGYAVVVVPVRGAGGLVNIIQVRQGIHHVVQHSLSRLARVITPDSGIAGPGGLVGVGYEGLDSGSAIGEHHGHLVLGIIHGGDPSGGVHAHEDDHLTVLILELLDGGGISVLGDGLDDQAISSALFLSDLLEVLQAAHAGGVGAVHHGDLGVGGQLLILVGTKDGLVQHTGNQVTGIGHVGGLNLENIARGIIFRIHTIQTR